MAMFIKYPSKHSPYALQTKKMLKYVEIKIMPTEKGDEISSSPFSIRFQFGFDMSSVGEIRGIPAVAIFSARHLFVGCKITKRCCKFGLDIWSSLPHSV